MVCNAFSGGSHASATAQWAATLTNSSAVEGVAVLDETNALLEANTERQTPPEPPDGNRSFGSIPTYTTNLHLRQ